MHHGVLHPGVLVVRRGVDQAADPVVPLVVDRAWGRGVLPVCPGELRACRVEGRRYICLHRS